MMKLPNCRTGLKLALLLSLVTVGTVTLAHPAEAKTQSMCLVYTLNSNGWYSLSSTGYGETQSECLSNNPAGMKTIFIPAKN